MKKNAAPKDDGGKITPLPVNGHACPHATKPAEAKPAPPEDWSTYAPAGTLRMQHVRCFFREFRDFHAELEIGPDSFLGVTLTCNVRRLKSLLWQLRESAAQLRAESYSFAPMRPHFFG